jgi:hypothetical protein
MSTASNLYAEKIFSEHPLALWALDDVSDYASLVDESDRDISLWSASGVDEVSEVTNLAQFTNVPFSNSIISKVSGLVPDGETNTIELVSQDITNFSSLNNSLGNVSIGTYIYANNNQLESVSIGYQYYDTTNAETIQDLKLVPISISNNWLFISETLPIISQNTNLKLVIKISYSKRSDLIQNPSMYEFFINGVTAGQWAEEFQSSSLGASITTITENIHGISGDGIEAKCYGLQDKSGYYLSRNKTIYARNSGIPMVYGAANTTILSPNNMLGNLPSLVVPGLGFLNNSGKHKEYTAEMWLRVNSNTTDQRRIFGPVNSTDGLYIDGPFIVLKINNNIGTYFVGEWYRPMLVHIQIIKNSASLLINGEQVISLSFNTADLTFPDQEYIDEDFSVVSNDWLGFYSYQDVSPIEIDCVAIYPYQVPSIVAKRRFVYGQGVEFPENTNTAYSGTSTFIDYAFAGYTNNYNYPDIGKFSAAVLDNVITENEAIAMPKYDLPDFVFDTSKTKNDLEEDLNFCQNEFENFITFRPNSSWNTTNGHILFNDFGFLKQSIKAFYGIFKIKSNSSKQDIIVIENNITKDVFSISSVGETIQYSLTSNGISSNIYTSYGHQIGELFLAGINIENFSKRFGGKIASFFGNRNNLSVYVGSDRKFENQFTGNIYSFSFSTAKNFLKISSLFSNSGVPVNHENIFNEYSSIDTIDSGSYSAGMPLDATGGYFDSNGDFVSVAGSFWQYYLDGGNPSSFAVDSINGHKPSYSIIAKSYFNKISVDAAMSGSWEDYIPLTYFAKYVDDYRGDKVYDLDFIQFNINYPAPSKFVEVSASGSWKYSDLYTQYSTPESKKYSALDNQLLTGYSNYLDLKNNVSRSYTFDTSKSLVKSYVTFQYIKSGANKSLTQFTTIEPCPQNGVIEPGSDWLNTAYEVVDNMIVYPPGDVDLHDLAIVTHLDIDVDSSYTKPIKIKTLQYASQSLSKTSPNPVGTRFGNQIYPYTKAGVYFDYKEKNPFTIYKGSTPYLYMTKNSGIQLRGNYNPSISRGISIPINKTKANSYKITAIQASIRFDEEAFPQSPMEVFTVQGNEAHIKFYMESIHPFGKRARLYAINANTGQLENGITFYWNGRLVKEPTLTISEWGMLGIGFLNPVDFSNNSGAFRITGPLLVNSVSSYQFTNLQELQQTTFRKWSGVKEVGNEQKYWLDWYPAYLWSGVLVLSSKSFYGISPADVYKTYTGTNKIIIEDSKVLTFKNYQYNLFNGIAWRSQIVDAV